MKEDTNQYIKEIIDNTGKLIKYSDNFCTHTHDVRQLGSIAEHVTSVRVNPNQYRVYDPDYVSPTLTSMGGGGRMPYIVEKI